jgi:NAD-dependent dihydropyrimidine dehydrogenase PreA subunit
MADSVAVKNYESESLGLTIEIDHDKCTGAGECVEVCPTEVYELVDNKSTAPNIDECVECCACVEACPAQAISHSSC